MDELLSQDEVNALLQGISEGKIETDKVSTDGSYDTYEFPGVESEESLNLDTFNLVCEKLSEAISESLTGALRKTIEMQDVKTEVREFKELMEQLPEMITVNQFSLEPLSRNCLLLMDGGLVFRLIELFFGGTGAREYAPAQRDFTPLEQNIIGKIAGMFLEDVNEAWKIFQTVDARLTGLDVDPRLLSSLKADEKILVMEVVPEQEGLQHKIQVCVPLEPLKTVLDDASVVGGEGNDAGAGPWAHKLKNTILKTPVKVTGKLGFAKITVLEGMRLSAGDLLLVDRDIDEDIPLLIQGVTKLKGKLGTFRGRYAVKISGEG